MKSGYLFLLVWLLLLPAVGLGNSIVTDLPNPARVDTVEAEEEQEDEEDKGDEIDDNAVDNMENSIESFDPEDPDFNVEAYTQFLQEIARNPININRAPADEIGRIPGVDLPRARAIVEYRRKVKPFESIDELTNVKGIGKSTVNNLRPYLTVGGGMGLQKVLWTSPGYWTHDSRIQYFSRFQTTLETPRGYQMSDEDRGYLGSQPHYYQRLQYWSDHLSFNVTQDKDPGETLGGPADFDYTSVHFALEDAGFLKTLVVGDYNLSFGQGLMMGGSGSFGKGSEVIDAPYKSESGVRPYTSSMETGYWRGSAITLGNTYQFTGFFSSTDRSASLINPDTSRFPSSSGYHRTQSDLERKDVLGERMWGGRFRAETEIGWFGISGYQVEYDKYITGGSAVYNLYDFRGRKNSVLSADYRLLLNDITFFGEAVRSRNDAYGGLAGFNVPFESETAVALAYRYYEKDLQSPYGAAFSESGTAPSNEYGFYLGVRHAPTTWMELKGYFDQYRFPSARFGLNQPSTGYEWLARAEVEPGYGLSGYVMARQEKREEDYTIFDEWGREQSAMALAVRNSYRLHLEYQVNSQFRLRSRGELIRSRAPGDPTEFGYLIYQDVRFRYSEKLRIDARVTQFETDSYASRVYQFENDLLYVFAIPALYGQGQRMYLLLNYEPYSFLEFWAKYSISIYEDRQTISSGLNTITDDQKQDFGIQMRVKF